MALPRGIRNNNPLNIRKGNNWKGEKKIQADPQFEEFESAEFGIRAGFIMLQNYINGRLDHGARYNTIRKIITKFAPPSENNTKGYIEAVCKWSGLYPDETIKFEQKNKMLAIMQAMIKYECGVDWPIDAISSAYDLI